MTEFYTEQHRNLQHRFDTQRLADRLEENLLHDALTESEQAFIEARDMFFLASVDALGRTNCA